MAISYEDMHKLGLDDQAANVTSGNAVLRINQTGSRPTTKEAQVIGFSDLIARILSGKNPDETDFAGISALIGGVIANPLEVSTTVYVATTGSDTDGLGTLASPWATIQKGMNDGSALRNNEKIIISVADGTYPEELVVPISFVGTIRILGNAANPENVVIDPNNLADISSIGIDHRNTACTLEVKGVTISRVHIGINCVASKVTIFYNKFIDVFSFLGGDSNSVVDIAPDTDGFSIMTGDASAGSTAVGVANNTTLSIRQPLAITNFESGIFTSLSSQLFTFASDKISISLDGPKPFAAMAIRNASSAFFVSGFSFDCGGAVNSTRCLEVSSSYVTFVDGLDFDMSNSVHGVIGIGASQIFSGSGDWTYTNVTTNVQLDYATVYSSDNDFDAGTIEFNKFSTESYGQDKRYIPRDNVEVGTTTTIDATPKVIDSIAVPDDSTVLIESIVRAQKDDDLAGGAGIVTAKYRNKGGTLNLIGVVSSDFESDSTYTANFVINGSSVDVQGKGALGNTVAWNSTTTIN